MSALFGSSKHLSQPPPSVLGAQANLATTNQQARVLPWFSGSRWMSCTWISDAFNVRTTEIKQEVGKGSQTTGYNYYACFAGVICNGVVDRITAIRFNDVTVWSAYPDGIVRVPGQDYVDITIPGRGIIRLYWGTETQGIDTLLASSVPDPQQGNAGQTAYRGQCYFVGNDILFGASVTTAPNVVFELSRTGTVPAYICANPKILTAGGDGIRYSTNPIAVIYEWWTDKRFSMGRTEADLDIPRLKAASDILASEVMGINPYIDTQNDLRSQVLLLFEYFDLYPTTYGGKFGVELVRGGGSAPRVAKDELIGDIQISGEQWEDTSNVTQVTFDDYQLYGQPNTATYREQANFAMTGRVKPKIVNRPWATCFSTAHRIASAMGRVAALPQISGTFSIRESQADIAVGGVFELETRDGQVVRCRCKQRDEPPQDSRAVKITFEEDHGWANTDFYNPSASARQTRPILSPSPLLAAVIDSPFAFSPDPLLPSVMFFAARQDLYTNAFDVWRSPDNIAYQSAASILHKGSLYRTFAVKANLSIQYPDTTGQVDNVVGIKFTVVSADTELLTGEWDMAAGLSHDLLAFFGASANEIMALFNVTKVSDGYTAKTVRALYDTLRRTHPINTVIWIQLREKVISEAWVPYSTQQRYFKFQPRFGSALIDLADITPVTHTENARSLLPLPPVSLKANNDGIYPTWAAGGADVVVSWVSSSRARTVFGLPLNEAQPPDLDFVQFQLWDRDNITLLDNLVLHAADAETMTIANSSLTFLGLGDFKIRAYGIRNSWESLDYTDLLVTTTGNHVYISSGFFMLQSTDSNWYKVRCKLVDGFYDLVPDQDPSPAPPSGSLAYAPIKVAGGNTYRVGLDTIGGVTEPNVNQTPVVETAFAIMPLTAQDSTNHRLILAIIDGFVTYQFETL